MAITSSAKKAIRSSAGKRIFNLRRKEALHSATKALLKTVASKDVAGAEKLLPSAYKAIDKAMKRGVIKKNTAARKKSRLARHIARMLRASPATLHECYGPRPLYQTRKS
ncbi:30S ribosomal protein S20 [Candidatus Kaiserbacteria bacterium]|nr:30S ribosomal protein S20 [Candidatus Kaiserbacteria bacterium]